MAREVTLVDAGLGNVGGVERALTQVGGAVRVTEDPDQVARSRMVVLPGHSAFGATTRAIVEGAMGEALRMVIERGDPFLGICLGMQLLFDGSDENGGQEGLHVFPGFCRRFPDGMSIPAEVGAQERLESVLISAVVPAPIPLENVQVSLLEDAEVPANDAGAAGDVVTYESREAASFGDWGDPDDRPTFGGSSSEGAANMLDRPHTTSLPAPRSTVNQRPAEAEATVLDETTVELIAAPDLLRRVKVPHVGWNEVEPTRDHYYFVHSYYAEAARSEDIMWMTTYGGVRFAAAVRRENVLGCQFHPEKSQRAGLKFLRAFLLGGWG